MALVPESARIALRLNSLASCLYRYPKKGQPFGPPAGPIYLDSFLLASPASPVVTLVHSDWQARPYQAVGTQEGHPLYAPLVPTAPISTLTYDGSLYAETYADGLQLRYQALEPDSAPAVHALVGRTDACGDRYTYTYGTGAEAGLRVLEEGPDGEQEAYRYEITGDTWCRLFAERERSACVTYLYDPQKRLTGWISPEGVYTPASELGRPSPPEG
ncbi:MAG: hypothetical protein IT210_13080 [Armatimonadetes bacterium]|nr:hypothetical protein [Armatimonadota bacterium]